MTPIRILLIGSVCTLMLCVSGCSGGRLRNLTARSDYQTLDELEKSAAVEAERAEADQRQEALAKAADAADATVAVSKEREVPAAEGTAATETQVADASQERRRFLGFVNPFRRASATDEISPDPFVEPTEAQAASQEVMTASNTDSRTPAAGAETSQPTVAEKFESTTIAEVEKQAESMFDEAAAKQEFSASDVAATEATAKPADTSNELSFADFLKQTQPKAEPLVSTEKAVAATQTTPQASSAATDASFDAFMKQFGEEPSAPGTTAAPETQVAAADQKSAFAAFDVAKKTEAATGNQLSSSNPFAEEVVAAAEPVAAAPEINPFEETAQKHGFTRSQQDPWAAFAATQNQETATQPTAGKTPSFAWNNAPEAAAIDERSQKLANVIQETHPTDRSQRSPFQAASFSQSTELRVPSVESIPEVRTLMIPGGSTSAATQSPFQDATAFQPAQPHLQHNAHLTAVPFDQLESAVDAATVEPAAITAEEPGSSWQWSGRTWFLLLGCIIVCVLLFMPDRRNRPNA